MKAVLEIFPEVETPKELRHQPSSSPKPALNERKPYYRSVSTQPSSDSAHLASSDSKDVCGNNPVNEYRALERKHGFSIPSTFAVFPHLPTGTTIATFNNGVIQHSKLKKQHETQETPKSTKRPPSKKSSHSSRTSLLSFTSLKRKLTRQKSK
ncbi:hypothetical protein M501DRAFT_513476 [Patellaria atrata CBS 101060]|uniref:Uncharacterized protein n=1 Tax=Patellaria atrata CBS 101060 TaxID=1346257 RepID=A0A9P4S3J1_9PEZI|nr:hypothetical protein M501DRAFT_513476 [Patellaria atrata CBS 101060]